MAFACVHIPDFMVQAAMRGEPVFPRPLTGNALRGRALTLVQGVPPQCRVVAASDAAMRAGIEIGMAKAQAEQFHGVKIRQRSPEQERNTHAALLDLGGSFSPHVEDTAPESIVLDLAGLGSLFGGAESVARGLAQGALDVCGLAARVAVASNPDTALHAARGFADTTVIPDGQETARLGPLPIGVLSPSIEALETLDRWGVRNCAALAALPVLDLSERLGAEGVRLHEWAHGARRRSLRLSEPALRFEEELAFEYDVAEIEPLAFLLSRMLEALCARLTARSLAAASVTMRLTLAPPLSGRATTGASQHEKCLSLPVPSRNTKLLLNLLRLQLQANPPRAPVRGVFLAAEPARPCATQGGFFVPSGPDPEKLELTLARLAHLVGESRVGSVELTDTYRPDAFRMRRFVPAEQTAKSGDGESTKARRENRTGFRSLRPALPARVETRAGRPARVFFQGLRGEVLAASGPWRNSGDWWEKDAWQQEEWDLEILFSGGERTDRTPLQLPLPPLLRPAQPPKQEKRRGLYRFAYDDIRRVWLVRGTFD